MFDLEYERQTFESIVDHSSRKILFTDIQEGDFDVPF